MLKTGEIVNGPEFPESVEIKSCVQINKEYYLVEAVGRQTRKFYEVILEESDLRGLARLSRQDETENTLTPRSLQHFLQYEVFQIEDKFSSARALGGGELLPLPHQIEAVYSQMLQAPQVRFLLADDPGAGKTIMAGMLIREMIARASLERVLILVPPLVLRQWQDELKEKFNLEFTIINRYSLRSRRTNPFVENNFSLASMYWAAKDEIKPYIIEGDYDLIIVDEAHKMAAYTHGKIKRKISRTKLYQLGELILRQTRHCLLLTATPHKGDMENFRHLLTLVDRDIFANITANETLREKSNPFVIRRLKENLKNFDGTPIFPKRTTKTIGYQLPESELELYEAVTEYVRLYFNRAINKGNNSTAFAMMLLQRRLSSSLEAIHLSLERRRNRLKMLLESTLEERKKYYRQLQRVYTEDYDDETLDDQQKLEEKLEQAFAGIDLEELNTELTALDNLLALSSKLKINTIEKKYQELEATLFGVDGLLKSGEKILIYTEATDTLHYLERKLLERAPRIAKIHGKLSIEERRRQVEFFKHECQIMLATDAGGEAINLQFCNQLINYDIPWNPNKLEQRMGRIHRIGQRNEVFVFNLVAANTREGDVLIRLLKKMDQMRKDLGADLVYDFVGDILEDRYYDLPTLMQEAVLNRESLDEIIAGMERTLSEEHKRLLEIVKEEMTDNDTVDLPAMRREQHDLILKKLSSRCCAMFAAWILARKRVRVYGSHNNKVNRIERLPKFIRDFARKKKIRLKEGDSYRFTGYQEFNDQDVELLTTGHPLFKLALKLTEDELEKVALERYMVSYPVAEPLSIHLVKVGITDGTGQELTRELLYLAKRENGITIELDPYWLFHAEFTGDLMSLAVNEDPAIKSAVLQAAATVREHIKGKRGSQLGKMERFLEKAFKTQYDKTYEKLIEYQNNNVDNRNSALINQMNAKLVDIEMRRDVRLMELKREGKILMTPPKPIVQLELMPTGNAYRVFPMDYKHIILEYEKANGRHNVKMLKAFALVDFYSERFNGEPRYIIVTENKGMVLPSDYMEDLQEIIDWTYIYVVKENRVVEEVKMADLSIRA